MNVQGNWFWKTAFVGVVWMSLVLSTNAETIVVNSLADTEGSAANVTLRWAINRANEIANKSEYTVIDMSLLTGVIVLESDLPPIRFETKIVGSGKSNLTISGNSEHRVFSVLQGDTIIKSLTVSGAYAKGGNGGNGGDSGGGGGGGMGAALFIYKGNVGCYDVDFVNNKVQGGNGGTTSSSYAYGSGGGGGFGGDGENAKSSGSAAGGSGGVLEEKGQGGCSGGDSIQAGNGGFGGGGGGGDGVYANGEIYCGGSGGFGGGGGGTHEYNNPNVEMGHAGLFGGYGSNMGIGGGGAGLGGAIFVRENAKLFLVNCSFTGNSAVGGLSPSIPFYSTTISGENGQGKGGAVFAMENAVVKVSNITFSGNTAGNPSVRETPAYFLNTPLDSNDFFGTFQEIEDDSTAFPPSAASNWFLYR